MGSPRRFGDYVLFKRLGVDDLGESYRAGRVAGASIERIVLLRLFNGRAIDRPGLWRSVAARGPVQKLLTSARLAEGIELGVVAGTPFAAYAYVSGPNLLELLRRARAKPFPIPTEHALFIAERTAQRLAAARETRIQGQRLHHGFLVPALVSLSVEGEVQVLGAELAPGLRAQHLLRAEPEIAPYLAPEAAADGAVHPADDVYSLAAILFELVTGEAPPADGEERDSALAGARLATDDTPLPQPLAELLRNSLTAREGRISGVDKWHGVLARLIAQGGHEPTTFNFAFFMHTLLREELDGERLEIEREQKQEVPVEVAAPAPAAGAAAPPAAAPPAAPIGAGRSAAAPRRSRWLVPALAAAILAAAGLVAAYYFLDWRAWLGTGDGPEAAPPATASTPAEPAPPVPAAEQAVDAPQPSVEEVEAQVRELLAQRTPQMEAGVRTEFDAKLERLRRQLADARAAARRRQQERERAPVAEPAESAPAAPGEPRTAPPAAAPEPGSQRPPTAPTGTPPATPPSPPAEPVASGGRADEAATATERPGAEPTEPRAEPKAASGPEPREASAPAAAERVEADPGPQVAPPRLLSQPQPQYPPAARKFGKDATVRLRLLIDESGRVVESERLGPKAGFGFDEAAERAARKTSWSPATRDGEPVPAWVELSVEFRP